MTALCALAAACGHHQSDSPNPGVTTVAGNGETGDLAPGQATASPLPGDLFGVATDESGTTYFIAEDQIAMVTSDGVLSLVAGTGNQGMPVPGPALQSPLYGPSGIAVDATGVVYIADGQSGFIEKVTPQGDLQIVAGNGQFGAAIPGPATDSPLSQDIAGVALDTAGNIYIADAWNRAIEKVTPDGTLSVFADKLKNQPNGIAVDGQGTVYLTEVDESEVPGGAGAQVEKLTPNGDLSILAGSGKQGKPISGRAVDSPLGSTLWGIAVDSKGNVFFSDSGAHGSDGDQYNSVDEVKVDGTLSVVVVQDQTLGLAVDSSDYLYMTVGNRVVRMVPE